MSTPNLTPDAPFPVLSMLLPACDRSVLDAQADGEGILWDLGEIVEGTDQDRLETFIGDVGLISEIPRRGRDCVMSRLEVQPDPEAIEVISGWLDLFEPLLTAQSSFNSMWTWEGAAYARSTAIFSRPAVMLFRSAVDTHSSLAPLQGWLDRYHWDAVLRGAYARDLALWGILSSNARFEGDGYDKCIRLHQPRTP